MLAFVLQILVCLLLATLIGFVVAWLLRGVQLARVQQRLQQLNAEQNARAQPIQQTQPPQPDAAQTRATDTLREQLQAEVAQWRARAEESDAMRQATLMRISSAEAMLQERNGQLKALTAELEKLAQALAAADAGREAHEQEVMQLRGVLAPLQAASDDAARVQGELSSTRTQLDDLERKLAAAEASLRQADELRTRIAELDARLAECGAARRAAEDRLAALAAADAQRRAKPPRQFAERPAQVDDLELIHGVGPVLRKMLNALGVWQFRQIALWDEADIEFFDQKLEQFHGRIRREAWVASAAKQHLKKYGERPDPAPQ
jgi:NADH-quinone oxidoreductase subunit E